MMDRSLRQMRTDRLRAMAVFRHRQPLTCRTAHGVPRGGLDAIDDGDDVSTIDLRELVAQSQLDPAQRITARLGNFCEQQALYFTGMSQVHRALPPVPGIRDRFNRIAVAHGPRLLAASSVDGGIAVYTAPAKMLGGSAVLDDDYALRRVWHHRDLMADKGDGSQMVAWSLSGRALAVLSKASGTLCVVHELHPSNVASLPPLVLSSADFVFTSGPFTQSSMSSRQRELVRPTCVAFFPAFTLLGAQPCLMVGLANGDVLRVNTDSRAQQKVFPAPVEPEGGAKSFIGAGLRAELYRGHKAPIVHIGFVRNALPMVTISDDGYVMLWEDSKAAVTG